MRSAFFNRFLRALQGVSENLRTLFEVYRLRRFLEVKTNERVILLHSNFLKTCKGRGEIMTLKSFLAIYLGNIDLKRLLKQNKEQTAAREPKI